MESKLIVIEGCDGCGKTSMMKDLKSDIRSIDKGIKVLCISLPYYNAFGYTKIRDILAAKQDHTYPPDVIQSLYLMNMIDCFENVVNPFFEENEEDAICILDRSIISTIIYNAMNNGSIYHSMRIHLKRLRLAGDNTINEDDSMIDLDTILNKYCHLNKKVDKFVFLQPPMDVVVERAKNRNSNEENDSVTNVQRLYQAYDSFYQFLAGIMPRNIIDLVESVDGMIKPNSAIADRLFLCKEWNRTITDEENHEFYRFALLENLGIKRK